MRSAGVLVITCSLVFFGCIPSKKKEQSQKDVPTECLDGENPSDNNCEKSSDVVNKPEKICPSGTIEVEGRCLVENVKCPDGSSLNSLGQCISSTIKCPDGFQLKETQCVAESVICPDGSQLDGDLKCVAPPTCPAGSIVDTQEVVCVIDAQVCPEGTVAFAPGRCAVKNVGCATGQELSRDRTQCIIKDVNCPDEAVVNDDGQCIGKVVCPDGIEPNEANVCLIENTICPEGSTRDPSSNSCVVETVECPNEELVYDEQLESCRCKEEFHSFIEGQCVNDELICEAPLVLDPGLDQCIDPSLVEECPMEDETQCQYQGLWIMGYHPEYNQKLFSDCLNLVELDGLSNKLTQLIVCSQSEASVEFQKIDVRISSFATGILDNGISTCGTQADPLFSPPTHLEIGGTKPFKRFRLNNMDKFGTFYFDAASDIRSFQGNCQEILQSPRLESDLLKNACKIFEGRPESTASAGCFSMQNSVVKFNKVSL